MRHGGGSDPEVDPGETSVGRGEKKGFSLPDGKLLPLALPDPSHSGAREVHPSSPPGSLPGHRKDPVSPLHRGLRGGLSAGGDRERPGHLDRRLQDGEDGQRGLVPQPGAGRLRLHLLPAAEHRLHGPGLPLALRTFPLQTQQQPGLPQHVRERLPLDRHQPGPLPLGGPTGVVQESPDAPAGLGHRSGDLGGRLAHQLPVFPLPRHGPECEERHQLLQQLCPLQQLHQRGKPEPVEEKAQSHDPGQVRLWLPAALHGDRRLSRRGGFPGAAQAPGQVAQAFADHRGRDGLLLPLLLALPCPLPAGIVQDIWQPSGQESAAPGRPAGVQPGLLQQLPQPASLRLRGAEELPAVRVWGF